MSASEPRALRVAQGVVGLALRLYPAPFRRMHGQEMRTVFGEQAARRLAEDGALGLTGLCLRTLAGMVAGAAAEWRWAVSGGGAAGWSTEVRHALRRLRRAPGFALVAAATLGLGVGAFTAVYSVVDAVLLEPMPYDDPEELVWVWRDYTWADFPRGWLGSMEAIELREGGEVFSEAAAMHAQRANLSGPEGMEPRDVRLIATTSELFDVLGRGPARGRGFLPADDDPGAPAVAVLGHPLWQSAFGGDPGVVGREIFLNGEATTVVGVLPEDFTFAMGSSLGEPVAGDLYVPLRWDLANEDPGGGSLAVLVRIPETVPPGRVQAELAGLADRVQATAWGTSPEDRRAKPLRLWTTPMREDLVGDLRAPLLAVLAAAGVLLTILTANMATLLLGRAAAGERDASVRAALGAGAGGVARSVLAEGLVLAGAGAAAGLVLGYWGTRLMAAAAAETLPRATEIGLDASGAAAAVALALGLSLMAGLLPLGRVLRATPAAALRATAGGGEPRQRVRTRSALVVAQTALCLVLLVSAGLLARSMGALLRVDPGFDPAGALTFRVAPDEGSYPEEADLRSFQGRLLERLEGLPGVRAAGIGDAVPLGQYTNQQGVAFPGAPGNTGNPDVDFPLVDVFRVSSGYLDAAGLRLLEGRGFTGGDGPDAAPVALIDDVLASQFFPDGTAVGGRIALGGDTVRIVGVVDQPRFYDVHRDDRGQVYFPIAQRVARETYVALRTGTDPAALEGPARAAVGAVDPRLPVSEVRTLEAAVAQSLRQERLNLGLVAAFAGAALLLAVLGIYGVVAESVTRRRREIGVRMAIGAEPRRVVRMVLRQGLLLLVGGLALGGLGALAAGRLLSSLLYGVSPYDPVAYVAVGALLGAVAIAACWLPAVRATRIDPAQALRAE